jgi:hypothetical protein
MERNPIFVTGTDGSKEVFGSGRHVLCPCYDACLNEAVHRDLNFHCNQCEYKKKNISAYLVHDGMAA